MEKPQSIVFYSWQSDLENVTNRGFIEEALKKAVKIIQKEDSIEGGLIIDRDTKGVPGSPDIASTIFGKIDQAQVFVCDISIINQEAIKQVDARPTPNPNVLIELGYALKALGDKHIIMLLNDAYGEPKLLPFDLYTRRATTYHMPFEISERAPERNRLAAILTDALRTILKHLDLPLPGEVIEPLSPAEQAKIAIETSRPNQTALVREYMSEIAHKIQEMTPAFLDNEQDQWDELLLSAIGQLTEMVIEFAKLSETIAQVNAHDAAQAMYEGFSHILNLYTYAPPARNLRFNIIDFDLAKFFGHELFVTFFSHLIRERRWEIVADLLDADLYARTENFSSPTIIPFHHLSMPILTLEEVRKRRLNSNRISHHADLLNERHTQGEIAKYVPMEQFTEADYFLFLRAEIHPMTIGSKWPFWMPWSSLYMKHVPRYLQEAKRIKFAMQLLRLLGVENIETLRTRLTERTGSIETGWGNRPFGVLEDVIGKFDFNTIGTQ